MIECALPRCAFERICIAVNVSAEHVSADGPDDAPIPHSARVMEEVIDRDRRPVSGISGRYFRMSSVSASLLPGPGAGSPQQ
jgi:hypothetical protein